MESRKRVDPAAWAASWGVLLAAVAPKCPLCIAAGLSAAGFGAAGATLVAPLVRPVVWLLTGLAVAVLVARAGLRARRRPRTRPIIGPPPGCCPR